jgi:hypothetical protein
MCVNEMLFHTNDIVRVNEVICGTPEVFSGKVN